MGNEEPALHAGLVGEASDVVDDADTAIAMGSGDVPVYATPALAALIERAAVAAVTGALPDGTTSVGTRIDLHHTAPSKVGAKVRAVATLTEISRKRLHFECEALDGEATIGRCSHERVIVDRERFLA